MMEQKAEDQQPFLGFRDDPTRRESTENDTENGSPHLQQQALKATRRGRLLRDFVVCLATSLLWVLAFTFFMSSPQNGRSNDIAKGNENVSNGQNSNNYNTPIHNITSNAIFVSCGNSTAEAKQNGCKYDTLLNYWVPSQCFDKAFEAEYQDDDTWAAFADKNLTERLAPEVMGEQKFYYTSILDHINHCSMLWKKQFWTLFQERAAFDGVIANVFHTDHCAEFLKDIYGSNRTEPTLVEVGYSGCWVRNGHDDL